MQPDQNVTATLSYPPSYLILARERAIISKNIGYFWIFCVLGDPKLRDLANLWSYNLIMT